MRHKLAIALATVLPIAGLATYAYAKMVSDFDAMPPSFQLLSRPIGGNKVANATAPHLAGSRIAAAGDGALVIDADSGAMIRTDQSGAKIGELAIGKNAGLLAYDPDAGIAYVADRM